VASRSKTERPAIYVAARDFDRLLALSESAAGAGARLLARELERAIVVEPGEFPRNFARLGSTVEYRDLLTGRSRTLQIVTPQAADVDAERVSVVSPVGAALIGLRPGDVFALSTEDGRPRVLQVIAVRAPQTEAEVAHGA
jgi:regulator of nucleoside diphosphate kinase